MVPKAYITQTQTFIARGTMKQKQAVVATLCGDVVGARRRETWHGRAIKIPPVGPSILQCRIIKVEYTLRVSLRCLRSETHSFRVGRGEKDVLCELSHVYRLTDSHSSGVCGHSWHVKVVSRASTGHGDHPSPSFWQPYLQREQPVQSEPGLVPHGHPRAA